MLRGALLLLLLLSWISPAFALEKTGRVQMEEAQPPEVQFALTFGHFFQNNSFAARPDNTGLVKYRYLGHVELTPSWSPITLVLDTNFFTDRKASNEFQPSEWDQTVGLLYRYERWAAFLRYERDMPIDKSGLVQAYSEIQGMRHWDDLLVKESEFYAGLGWLFATQNYFARPNNTGRALFRYVLHGEIPIYRDNIWIVGDTNFYTDRETSNPVRPSELDWITGIAFRWKQWEAMIFQETDQPLYGGGLVQKYFAIQLRWSWEKGSAPEVHTMRDQLRAQGWR